MYTGFYRQHFYPPEQERFPRFHFLNVRQKGGKIPCGVKETRFYLIPEIIKRSGVAVR